VAAWLDGNVAAHDSAAARRYAGGCPLFDLYAGTSDHTGALDLRAAVRDLPGEQRLVVALRFYGGMRATEIAEALDIPAATVRTRLHRALITLRTRLQPSDGRLRSTRHAEGGW
jgi:DNA-directed RNA polymerase specialized sigma24 family protein